MSKFNKFIKNPGLLFRTLGHRGFLTWMDDSTYLKILYFVRLGERLHLDHPQTFNEKLQWLKLHDRNPLYTTLVDKYAVKNWVANKIGKQYVVPTLGVWNHFDEIDFDKLPNQFVLKCTHNSGGIVLCKDKKTFDKKSARCTLSDCLRHNFFWGMREWPYKDVPPRIIAEKYMKDVVQPELIDYKFYVFNGEPKYVAVSQGMVDHATAYMSYMKMDWSIAPFSRTNYPPFPTIPPKPVHFADMCRIAKLFTTDISFLRVDFYEINNQVYVGELTFFPSSGHTPFFPKEWDRIVGSWLKLPPVIS